MGNPRRESESVASVDDTCWACAGFCTAFDKLQDIFVCIVNSPGSLLALSSSTIRATSTSTNPS